MKVRSRLLLFGVLAPAVGLVAAVGGAGYLFRREALASVDRELVARAAVESVGAFDGPERAPHLHLGRATFPPGFVDLDPRGALYDAQRMVARDPPDQPAIARGPFGISTAQSPLLWSADGRREFAITLHAPDGALYLLRLSCSLGPVQQTLTAYLRTTTALLACVVLALLGLWAWLARSLSQRLEHITERLPAHDELPRWRAATSDVDDEISALDRALAAAFARLRKAKDTQDEFIARAAHELKTPLGVMAAEMDLALSRDRPNAALRQALVASRGDVRRLAELSTRLLDLTAVNGAEIALETVDLVRTLYDILDHMSSAIEEARVKLQIQSLDSVYVRGDVLMVRQAIENLLANALRYSPPGATLQLSFETQDSHACLYVRDEGPGIPEAERERVFDPFVRGTHALGQGTGLGLAIVRAVAQRLGGSVEALPSERGAVLRLCLRLPG